MLFIIPTRQVVVEVKYYLVKICLRMKMDDLKMFGYELIRVWNRVIAIEMQRRYRYEEG